MAFTERLFLIFLINKFEAGNIAIGFDLLEGL